MYTIAEIEAKMEHWNRMLILVRSLNLDQHKKDSMINYIEGKLAYWGEALWQATS